MQHICTHVCRWQGWGGANDPQDPDAGSLDPAATSSATTSPFLCFSNLIGSLELSQSMRLGTVMVVSLTSTVGARAGGGGQGQSAKVLNPAPWFRMHGQAPQPGGRCPTNLQLLHLQQWLAG